MNEKFYPNYENSEAINRELKRLIESATAHPTAQAPPTPGGMRSRVWRLLSCALFFLILTGALLYLRQPERLDPASARNGPPNPLAADDAVTLSPKQLRSVTVEPVSREVITNGRKALIVPDSAVIVLDAKPLVFVEEAPGRFRGRLVEPGIDLDGRRAIERGLQEGERVVTHGAILLSAVPHK
jgi:hypothetical protein